MDSLAIFLSSLNLTRENAPFDILLSFSAVSLLALENLFADGKFSKNHKVVFESKKLRPWYRLISSLFLKKGINSGKDSSRYR